MTEECAFHITTNRLSLENLVMTRVQNGEWEFSGIIGNPICVTVTDCQLIEIIGSKGTIRLSIEPTILKEFVSEVLKSCDNFEAFDKICK